MAKSKALPEHIRALIQSLPTKDEANDWLTRNDHHLGALGYEWRFWRRPDQTAPLGDWRCWLILAGRGFGKTRTGAEWVRAQAEATPGLRIALVGATLADVRAVMVEGESGLLAISPDATRPNFEPSLRRLSWHNGAVATLYAATEPDGLRGPEHHIGWADECAKWEHGIEAWDNLTLGLRLGEAPRLIATTTPRPVPLIRRLMTEDGIVVTQGRTADNAINLPRPFMAAMTRLYDGTRIGRQELDGQLITEVEGALWTRTMIAAARIDSLPALRRVVVAVDPPASATGDACGIIVGGLGTDGLGYVLADASIKGATPEAWARQVAEAARQWQADRVVAEANNGGLMVESVLRAANAQLPIKLVRASYGKVARAEPVAALYERGRVRHAAAFPALEDELCGLVTGGAYHGPGRSPDRADALVWAMTELMLGRAETEPRVRVV